MTTSTIEKILSAPPVAVGVGITVFGLHLSDIAALMTIIWTGLLIYFRIRKEVAKWQVKRAAIATKDADLLALHVRDMTADSE